MIYKILKIFIKIIIYLIICSFIAAPVTAIIIMHQNNFSIFNDLPVYIISLIIALVFLVLSSSLLPLGKKLFKRNQLVSDEMPEKLIKEISYITSVEDIIVKIVDILSDLYSIESVFAMLPDKESKILNKYYGKGIEEVLTIDYSPFNEWLINNNKIIILDKFYKNKKVPSDIKEYIIQKFTGKNIKIIMPFYNIKNNKKDVTGIICIGQKKSRSKYKINEINRFQVFNDNCNHYIKNSMDYEDWNRDQLESGVMDLSSEILSKSVPVHLPKTSEISFGAFYIPWYREGIDYFDFITPTNIGAGVIVTDIPGSSIKNAIYSVILRSAFHSCIEEAHSTFTIIQKLNKALNAYAKGEDFIKAYYFYYNISDRRLTFTNAGYQPMGIYRVEKNYFESLDTEGSALGTDINANYGMGRTILLVGDIGFLYSNSLIESKNSSGEKFGLTQLQGIIKENRQKQPDDIAGIIKKEFISFMKSSSIDTNILVIVFKV